MKLDFVSEMILDSKASRSSQLETNRISIAFNLSARENRARKGKSQLLYPLLFNQ